jgi:hypothetical protein
MDDLIEVLADYAHRAWGGWMVYLFSKCTQNEDGSMTIPAWAVDRWKRQMAASYDNLPEEEKFSDRKEAGRIIAILKEWMDD